MALTKKLQALGVTGKTVYALIIRASDGYFLQSALTSFAVGVSYPALAEDATVKGLYTLSTAGVAWSDGLYSAIIYQQAGGSPAPAADQVIAGGDFNIAADATMAAAKVDINDKTGFSLATPPPPTAAIVAAMDASSTKLASILTAATAADSIDSIIPGSNPPTTRAAILDRLYIPAYVGPVVVTPAVNPDPATQYVHFYGKQGDKTPSAGRTVTATPTAGQILDQNLIDKQVLSGVLDEDGYCFLTLIRGLEYTITLSWWGSTITITVTNEADKTMTAYLA